MANKIVTFNGKTLSGPGGIGMVIVKEPEPTLPPMTLRFQFSDLNYDPSEEYFSQWFAGEWRKVESQYNQWDWTCDWMDSWSNIFTDAFTDPENLVSIIDAGDTSSVTNTSTMFDGCSSLTSIALFDTSNVTDMSFMFEYCSSLKTVPLFNTSNVTNMMYMFNDCSSLEEVPLFDTSNVTDMYGMFFECTKLESVPLFNTSNVTDMSMMFQSCESLIEIPLFDTSNVEYMFQTFADCYEVQYGALALYQQASSQQNPPNNYQLCFEYCGINTETGRHELNEIPSSWGGWGS